MELKSPFYIELSSLNDFGRLVCALERSPSPIFSMELNKEQVFSVQTEFIDGNPVIYYIKNTTRQNSQYLAYRINSLVEEVIISDSAANSSYVYSPIINIDKLPIQLTKKARPTKKTLYTSIKVKDLASLAKVAGYKTIYEEPPLPLFLIHNNYTTKNKTMGSENIKNVTIGTVINIVETESLPYFYYYQLDIEPSEVFLRYSSQRVEKPIFSNNLNEHGYIYLKIIKLLNGHPLVNI